MIVVASPDDVDYDGAENDADDHSDDGYMMFSSGNSPLYFSPLSQVSNDQFPFDLYLIFYM